MSFPFSGLSHFEGHRVDIPADKYEGCRQASRDVKLGQHTFNRIKELDTKRYLLIKDHDYLGKKCCEIKEPF